MRRVFVDLDLEPFRPRVGLTAGGVAEIECVLGDALGLAVIFHRSGTRCNLDDGTTGALTMKAKTALSGNALLLDLTMVKTADETDEGKFYYLFEGVLDTEEIMDAMPAAASVFDAAACVSWIEPGKVKRKTSDIPVKLENSSERPEDSLPAKAGQSVVTNDEFRVLCPDGVWRRVPLADLAE